MLLLDTVMFGWDVPAAWLVPPDAAPSMSFSIAVKRRGEQLGLNKCSSELLHMRADFFRDPTYLFAKGFCIITWGTRWHMVTLRKFSKWG